MLPGLQAAAWAQAPTRPKGGGEDRLHSADRLRFRGHGRGQGFDKKYGIKIVPTKEASWASVRDKLVNGELDAAHVLYGLIYGVQLGVGGPKKDMSVLMGLNHNGQAITLANKLKDAGVTDGASLKKLITAKPGEYTFAQTFPTGTHAMWLYYWLAARHQPDEGREDDHRAAAADGRQHARRQHGRICVGEPWNNRAIMDKIGFTAVTTQDIWTDHPEKVLGTTADFVAKYPKTAIAMMCAIIEAGRWIDASLANRRETAETIAQKAYVNTDTDVILERMLGRYSTAWARAGTTRTT